MTIQNYRVYFAGHLVEGVTPEAAKAGLMQLGMNEAQASSLAALRPATIKRNLSRDQAQKYQQRLQAAGLLVEIEIELALMPSDDAPDLAQAAAKAEQDESPGTWHAAPAMRAQAADAEPAADTERFSAREPTRSHATEVPVERRIEPIRFTGNGSEYFGIWIVNILLMIVTLGFYAPWAKVRNAQYFYGHTELDGSSFQYLADPWVIFRGRLVAIVAVIIWAVASEFYPIAGLILVLLFLPLLPWIVVRSLKFHAVNSAWRNIRFNFNGTYGGACMVLFVWPLVALLTLFLAFPLSMYKAQAWRIDNTYFGTMPFRLKASAGDFFLFFLKLMLIAAGFGVVSSALSTAISPWLGMPVLFAGYLVLFGYFMAGLQNLILGSTVLGMHNLHSNLGKGRMLWIFMTNSILVVLTLGLYTPWAKVRMAQYMMSCTQLEVSGDLDHFIAAETERTSALGQELGEAFDVGVSFI